MEVEYFWLLVGDVGEYVEYYVVDDDVVEVGDQEQVVVQYEVDGWDCQYYVGYVVDGEGDYEVDGLQYWGGELYVIVEYGEQLVEDFYVGGNGDDYCCNVEEGIDVGI